jgi:prepilin-type N-terminal cleavage/methylation domain-containing protein
MPILSVGKINNRGQRGVTLIEMLVVCAIIGLIASVSLPSVAAGMDSVRIATASQSISTFLNSAVNHAERRQRPVEVLVLPKEGRLMMYSTDPGFERELKMPGGIVIETVLPKIDDSSDLLEGRRLILMPGASAPGIGIQIANSHGSRRIIHLDPMTGFPRVESVGANTGNNSEQ